MAFEPGSELEGAHKLRMVWITQAKKTVGVLWRCGSPGGLGVAGVGGVGGAKGLAEEAWEKAWEKGQFSERRIRRVRSSGRL